jgi:hypothetical protein
LKPHKHDPETGEIMTMTPCQFAGLVLLSATPTLAEFNKHHVDFVEMNSPRIQSILHHEPHHETHAERLTAPIQTVVNYGQVTGVYPG